jgi:hypothetical protein
LQASYSAYVCDERKCGGKAEVQGVVMWAADPPCCLSVVALAFEERVHTASAAAAAASPLLALTRWKIMTAAPMQSQNLKVRKHHF